MSRLAEIIRLDNHAVAIYREQTLPEDAFVPQNGHCTIPSLFVRCTRLGGKCAADSAHSPCHGSKSGFGFGGIADRQRSAWSASTVPEEVRSGMAHGSSGMSYFATPEIALLQMEPIRDYGDGSDAIVFQDLDDALSQGRPIEVVAFLVDPMRLSVLQQLVAFSKTTPGPAAIMPYGHACQQVYAIPRGEGESDDPRAVIGMTDLYARRYVDKDRMSFAVPYKLYRRMEEDIDASFLAKTRYKEYMDACLRPSPFQILKTHDIGRRFLAGPGEPGTGRLGFIRVSSFLGPDHVERDGGDGQDRRSIWCCIFSRSSMGMGPPRCGGRERSVKIRCASMLIRSCRRQGWDVKDGGRRKPPLRGFSS